MTDHMRDAAQAVKVTDAMAKAGAAAMCCQAQTLGCAAQHKGSEFTTCMLSSFIPDAKHCLEAALSLSRPLLCAHGVKIGNTCVGCMGAATLASHQLGTENG